MTMKRTKLQEHLQNNVFQRFPMPELPPQHFEAVLNRILARKE